MATSVSIVDEDNDKLRGTLAGGHRPRRRFPLRQRLRQRGGDALADLPKVKPDVVTSMDINCPAL